MLPTNRRGASRPQRRPCRVARPPRRCDELDADGQSVFCREAARDRDARDAGEVDRDRRDVVEVHLQRIVDLLADLERGGRCRRRRDDVHLREGVREVLLDERADLLCTAVVGVVVPRRQCVRAEDDASFDLFAEAGVARRGHDVLDGRVAIRSHTETEAHGVELREVAGCLGGEDQIVRGDAVLEVGRSDLDDLCTLSLHERESAAERLGDARLEPAVGQFPDDADPEAFEHISARALTGGIRERRPLVAQRCGVLRVVTADRVMQQTCIEHGARHRSDLVEAGSECDRAVAADTAVGGLDADRAGHMRGLTDGSTGV